MNLLRKAVHIIFWIAFGVVVHDYAHALWQVGGYMEIVSLQGGWIGLAVIAILWIVTIEAELKAKGISIKDEVPKGLLLALGIALAQHGLSVINSSPEDAFKFSLAGAIFVAAFAVLMYLQLSRKFACWEGKK